jgi:hypothetical protein
MSDNEVRGLAIAYKDWSSLRMPGLADVDPFEFFCADQFLKPYSMSDAEIISGLVDKSQDGGIDAFYFFLNGVLVNDNTPVDPRATGEINLVIMQIKESAGFSPIDIDKIYFFTDDLLNIGKQPAQYHTAYHEKLSDLMRVFKQKYDQMSGVEQKVTLDYYFITGNDAEPGEDAIASGANVCAKAKEHFRRADVKPFHFITATRLYLQVQIRPLEKKVLAFEDWFESNEGWVGLVRLRAFYDFIKDDRETPVVINERFLEENVRGYQIDTPVNQKISITLESPDSPEFWLLNNGITILTPLAEPKRGKNLEINDPQVVNGLQTSRRIFDYFNDETKVHVVPDTRRILVKVVQTDDARTRDEIIRATNNQNKMPAEALISTYGIQRLIEDHFRDNELYYDRRKGHYKAQEKAAAQIVSVTDLVQAVVSIIVKRPDDARGRPLDYIKTVAKRWQVFGTTEDEESEGVQPVAPLDLDVYLRCVQVLRKVNDYLRRQRVDSVTKRNVGFYMARCAAVAANGNAYFPPHELMRLDVDAQLNDALLADCYTRVHRLYQHAGGDDDAAKSQRLSASLSSSLIRTYSPPNRSQTR